MNIILRKLQPNDTIYFAKWWRNYELIELTSGNFDELSDLEVNKYFQNIYKSTKDYNWMIEYDGITIGHISLNKRPNNWYETQIVIGEKNYWSKGIGGIAIDQSIQKAKEVNILKIYLEVRPENLRAIHAYEKIGFKKTKHIKYPDNQNLPETIRMEYD